MRVCTVGWVPGPLCHGPLGTVAHIFCALHGTVLIKGPGAAVHVERTNRTWAGLHKADRAFQLGWVCAFKLPLHVPHMKAVTRPESTRAHATRMLRPHVLRCATSSRWAWAWGGDRKSVV